MTIGQIKEKIKKTGLKKKFIAAELGIDPTYLSTFFSDKKYKRAMPLHISLKLQAFLEKY